MQRTGTGTADVENQGFGRDIRGLVGRWPDTDGILQGAMSEGLRDWDLWYAFYDLCKQNERITDTHLGGLLYFVFF